MCSSESGSYAVMRQVKIKVLEKDFEGENDWWGGGAGAKIKQKKMEEGREFFAFA